MVVKVVGHDVALADALAGAHPGSAFLAVVRDPVGVARAWSRAGSRPGDLRWSPIRGQCRGIATLGSGPCHAAASMTAGPA